MSTTTNLAIAAQYGVSRGSLVLKLKVDNFMQYGADVKWLSAFPTEAEVDADLINAGKQTITALPGAVYFDSATSFAMIRGQHVQLTVLGAMEVSQDGDIANWKIPGRMVKGMGGAMDLVASAENIVVAMMHTNKRGESKLLPSCSLPLTGVACVKRVVTNLAVLDIRDGAFHLVERAPGVTEEEIKAATDKILKAMGNKGHVMNLGHGIEATTPEPYAALFVDAVHDYKHE